MANMDSNSTTQPQSSGAVLASAQVLVADIGGTNARFAIADALSGAVLKQKTFATVDFAGTQALIDAAVSEFSVTAAAFVAAIAGPVDNGNGKLTNGSLEFSQTKLSAQLDCPALLLNDFAAVAAAIDDSIAVTPIGTLTAPGAGVRAVLGPGTGLGMSYLVPVSGSGGHFQVMPSEGGNADFAPADELQQEVLAIARRQARGSAVTISTESLVSGRGLPLLYQALCELWGATPTLEDAQQISAQAIDEGADVIAHKCLELFCAMLGSAAGNFALTVGARGGVYLAGGILPRIREFFLASEFRASFDERGALSPYTRSIATFLVDEPDPGLRGAIRQAQQLLSS